MEPKEEIRHRLPVEEVVGEYLELKPAGGGSLKTICPFHGEKTPSFYVSKEKQIWHCFGCDKGGDIFSFVMEMEGVEFPEALRLLAKKAGVEIPRYDSTQSNERARLVELNELARRFFEKVYTDSDKAVQARAYVASRGIDEDLRAEFSLGYAPEGWDTLASFLGKRGYGGGEMVAAGLALNRKQGSGVIDRFRDRLMVPLLDAHGNTVAFTGRVLPGKGDDAGSKIPSNVEGPKYMNSPETAVYHKGELLYGLSKAKQAIKLEKAAIIVEGNLDVIASHKAGVKNVVASSGTALTQAQIRLLSRYTATLVFCFDKDAAGFNAALRGIHLATEMGMRVRVLLIPADAGKDPDEVVQKDSELWQKIVAAPIGIMEYYFEHAASGKNLADVEVKREVGHFLVEEIGRLKDPIEREHWLSKLGDLLRMDVEVLRGMLKRTKDSGKAYPKTAEVQKPETRTREDRAIEVLLSIFLQCPSEREVISKALDEMMISDARLSRLYRLAHMRYHAPQQDVSPLVFFSALEAEAGVDAALTRALRHLSLLGERIASDVPSAEISSYVQEHLRVLSDAWKKRRRSELERELHAAEARGDKEAVQRLLEAFQKI